jgi:hypothetical protein
MHFIWASLDFRSVAAHARAPSALSATVAENGAPDNAAMRDFRIKKERLNKSPAGPDG